MSRTARVVQILIASPGDVKQVRELIPPLFVQWNAAKNFRCVLHPKMWEHDAVPTFGNHPQDILDEQLIEESDLLVAVFWGKLGSPTRRALSGTIQEIETFIERKGPQRVMLYFWDKPLEASPFDINTDEVKRLQLFRLEMQQKGLFHVFSTEEQFRTILYRHLDIKIAQLLDGKLPLPPREKSAHGTAVPAGDSEKWRFGDTLDEIRRDLSDHWSGITARGNKFKLEGAELLATAAHALDRWLASPERHISDVNRSSLERISVRLKKLSLNATDKRYRGSQLFWREGEEIADAFSVQVDFMLERSAD